MRRSLRHFGRALRDFLRGFVGAMRLPQERRAAEHALAHRCLRRDRCC